MSATASTRPEGPLLIVLGGIIGLLAALYGYFAALTGITGTLGALIVCLSSAALIVAGVALWGVVRPFGRGLWLTLGFLGALGTLAAGYMLHAWILVAAMILVLIGLFVTLIPAGDRRRAA